MYQNITMFPFLHYGGKNGENCVAKEPRIAENGKRKSKSGGFLSKTGKSPVETGISKLITGNFTPLHFT